MLIDSGWFIFNMYIYIYLFIFGGGVIQQQFNDPKRTSEISKTTKDTELSFFTSQSRSTAKGENIKY